MHFRPWGECTEDLDITGSLRAEIKIIKLWKNHLKNFIKQHLLSVRTSSYPTNGRFAWFWLFVTSLVFYRFLSAASTFHLYDQVVRQSLFHLALEDSFTKAVMQIRLKYGQTVFEVNGAIGGSKERVNGEHTSETKIKAGLWWEMNTNKWTLCQIQYVSWLLIIWVLQSIFKKCSGLCSPY